MEFNEAIKSLQKQLQYEPKIINGDKIDRYERFIFVGMGGSALGPDLLRVSNPELDILIHRDYGLPDLPDKVLQNSLIILNSYSGNTEEVLNTFNLALNKNLTMVAVSVSGKLLELARQNLIPYIEMPDWELEPRLALGLNLKALLKVLGQDEALDMISKVQLEDCEKKGKELAEKLRGFVPIIYSSRKNGPVAYAWKVKINETAKKPAFSNVFPELNHNEMAGFHINNVSKLPSYDDCSAYARLLSQNFHFIFLKDNTDNPRISKRMEVTAKLFQNQKLNVETVELSGDDVFTKIFSSLQLADWVSYYIAKEYGIDPADISAIEEFKKLI
jgi:glucose/mannose-6-phosphate isomerase